MKGEQLLRAFSYVDAELVQEAAQARGRKRRGFGKALGGLAACAVLAAALSVLPLRQSGEAVLPESGDPAVPPPSVSQDDGRQRGQDAAPVIDLAGVRVVSLDASAHADYALRYWNEEEYDAVEWERDDIAAYYGWDLTPPYLPTGFAPRTRGISATVYYEKNGALVCDAVGRGFYHAYYDDGSPRLTDDVAAVCGFSISASRLGVPPRCYVFPCEEDMEGTKINGTEVFLGYDAMPYGPYDPETHEPAGYYDLYVVQFSMDGASYELIFEQLPLREVVRVTASILCGTADVTVTDTAGDAALTGTAEDAPCRTPSTLGGVLRYIAGLLRNAADLSALQRSMLR